MSLLRRISLTAYCPRCGTEETVYSHSDKDARETLRGLGWIVGRKNDPMFCLCPECSQKIKEKKERREKDDRREDVVRLHI